MSKDTSIETSSDPTIRLHANDNVLVARKPIEIGEIINSAGFKSKGQIPAGHKIAARDIVAGEKILKYNVCIGFAAKEIPAGSYVHSHNISFQEFDRDYAYSKEYVPTQIMPESEQASFEGYIRANGEVGTRNYIGILSTVNCSATVVHKVAEAFKDGRLGKFPNIDGVVGLSHGLGCGMEMSGEPMELLRRTLGGYARHANFAAVLIIGLGCERNQLAGLLEQEQLENNDRLQTFIMQESGGTRKTVEAAVAAIEKMLPAANQVKREKVSAKHLKIGLQCGGSDGFSSITANPALGAAMDILVRHGGTAILSETPEIYGVEHTFTRRAQTPAVGQKLIERIRWWKEVYSPGRDVQINGAVSPGNQMGGLANIFEKSLGSSMKGGTTGLMEVYRYAQRVTQHGLVFMDTPGFDPVSATGQIAGGANLICFTTGRGSMFGAKPVPSMKLATNTPMYERLIEDMDLNCGEILDGTKTLNQVGQEIFEMILKVASGQPTKSELLDLGDHEFVPWNIGVVS